MKYFILLSFLFLNSLVYAQDCTKEALAKLPGDWKKGMAGSISNVSPSDLVQERAVLNNIHKLISDNYKPSGCQVSYSFVFGKNPKEGKNWIADPYYYQMYILRYLCDKNSTDKSKYYTDVSTPTTCQISANCIYDLKSLLAAELPDNQLRGYLELERRPLFKDGYYYMGEEVAGDPFSKNKIMAYSWLVTYNDSLPFYYVSRKEYLELIKKRLEKTIAEQIAYADYYKEFKDRITEYLNKPAAYLSQTAVCMGSDEERFKGFVPEGTAGSFIAIKPNPTYYRKNLPVSVPQFFHIRIKIAQGDPVFEKNIEDIKKAIDFAKLKTLLGKK